MSHLSLWDAVNWLDSKWILIATFASPRGMCNKVWIVSSAAVPAISHTKTVILTIPQSKIVFSTIFDDRIFAMQSSDHAHPISRHPMDKRRRRMRKMPWQREWSHSGSESLRRDTPKYKVKQKKSLILKIKSRKNLLTTDHHRGWRYSVDYELLNGGALTDPQNAVIWKWIRSARVVPEFILRSSKY